MDVVTSIVELAEKLSQAGITLILVFLLLLAIWGCYLLFNAFKDIALRAVMAIEAQSAAVTAQTRAIEEATRVSEANRATLETFRAILEAMSQAASRTRR